MLKLSRQGKVKPYTEEEIKKCTCHRCGAPAKYQWQICSDNNIYRPICEECDIELNLLVLMFMRFPDVENKLKRYVTKVKQHKDISISKVQERLREAVETEFFVEGD